jgi:7,8-dihydro-6-hydroxymethylpterin-pyrophosphokinase
MDQRDAVIAFGSNLGDRAATLHAAATALAAADGVELTVMSGLHESIATTTLAPAALLALMHRIEADHGRQRAEPWADRTLDLDLIDYAGLQQNRPGLMLPHPRAHERGFVLRPWLEVDPDAVLPGSGRVADLVAALDVAGHPEVTP